MNNMENEVMYLKRGERQEIVATIYLPVVPMGAVRTTARGKHTERAKRYHKWKESLQWSWKAEIMKLGYDSNMVVGGEIIALEFGLPISNPDNARSKDERMYREGLVGKAHSQKPDIDNLFKAFIDAVCYGGDDSHIHTVGLMRKVWDEYGGGYIKVTCSLRT